MPDIIKVAGKPELGEVKNYSPWVRRNTPKPTGLSLNGDSYAFGNTEERLEYTVMGAKQRGVPSMPAFDHTTGSGFVAAQDGGYSDAINNRKADVNLLVHETTGAICPSAARHLRRLARDAKANDCDGTDYRNSGVTSFVAYYAQHIVTACVMYGAEGVLKGVDTITKAQLRSGAGSAAAM